MKNEVTNPQVSMYGPISKDGGSKQLRARRFDLDDPQDRQEYEDIKTKAYFQIGGFRLIKDTETMFAQKENSFYVYMEWEEPK
jgi:hypothetical protein